MFTPLLESALPVCKRQAGISAGKGWIQPDCHLEKIPGQVVIDTVESIHMPKPAMVRFPCVQGRRWLQDGPATLGAFYFDVDRRDDLIADLIERAEGVVKLVIKDVRPNDARRPGLYQLDVGRYMRRSTV